MHLDVFLASPMSNGTIKVKVGTPGPCFPPGVCGDIGGSYCSGPHGEKVGWRGQKRQAAVSPAGVDGNNDGGPQQVVNSLNNNFVDRRALALHAMLLATAAWLPVGGPAFLLFVMILLAVRNAAT